MCGLAIKEFQAGPLYASRFRQVPVLAVKSSTHGPKFKFQILKWSAEWETSYKD